MKEFVKRIKLEFEADSNSIDEVAKDLDVLKKYKIIDDSTRSRLTEDLKSYKKTQAEIQQLKKQIADISKLETNEAKETVKALKEQVRIRNKELGITKDKDIDDESSKIAQVFDDFKSSLVAGLKSLGKSFIDALKTLISNSIQEMQNMLGYSRLSNQSTRDLAFTYGFNAAQGYGFDKAKHILGIQSDEDLYFMNNQQRNKFQEMFTKYSEKYSKLYDSGFFDTLEEYNVEMADFRGEMQMEVIRFFMDNKESIKAGMKAIMQLTEFVISGLGWLITYFGGRSPMSDSTRSANTMDVINNYSNSNSRSVNVKIDNMFNNVAKNDRSWLQNAGQMTYEQIIHALK